MGLSVFCFMLLYISTANCVKEHFENFYWRDYNGVVPEDALPAGKDINGEEIYIGQVYHHGFGFLIAQLIPKQPMTYYTSNEIDQIYNATSGIKIFCTDEPEKFMWVPVSNTTSENDNIKNYTGFTSVGKRLTDYAKYTHNKVGRLMYNGATKVGASWKFDNKFSKLCFVDKDREKCSPYYEILIFDNEGAVNKNFD